MNYLDDIDIKLLKENYDEETIRQIDLDNVSNILKYLYDNNVYYAKDLFINSFDLFLLPYETFVNKFEHLKSELGNDYIKLLGEDSSLIEIMYKDI